jgi:hypothetical protein
MISRYRIVMTTLAILITSTSIAFTVLPTGTPISGEITTTTWTKAGSPYRITDASTIPAGNTLTIQAGVEVVFTTTDGITVEGTVFANGVEGDSVSFRSDPATASPYLVQLDGGNGVFGYTVVQGSGTDGTLFEIGGNSRISVNDSRLTSDGMSKVGTITGRASYTRCLFQRVGLEDRGIVVSRLDIIDCLFVLDYGIAIATGQCSLAVRGTSFLRSEETSLYLPIDANAPMAFDVSGCTFSSGGRAINCGQFFPDTLHTAASIRNCSFTGAGTGTESVLDIGWWVDIDSCRFTGNTTDFGLVNTGGGTIRRSLFADNIALDNTGIIRHKWGHLSLTNCTVAGNTTSAITGASVITFGTLAIISSIIRSDAADHIAGTIVGTAESITVTYSDISGGWTGTGNIDADPLFTDAAGGDYSLAEGSPCIDAGSPATLDPDGSRSDMGYLSTISLGTEVSGQITTDTWTKAGSPYYVAEHCSVLVGNTLTIEAGAEVVIDTAGWLKIDGALFVNGTEDDSVTIRASVDSVRMSSTETPAVIFASTDSCALNYVRVPTKYGGERCWGPFSGGRGSVVSFNHSTLHKRGTIFTIDATLWFNNCTFIDGSINSEHQPNQTQYIPHVYINNCEFREVQPLIIASHVLHSVMLGVGSGELVVRNSTFQGADIEMPSKGIVAASSVVDISASSFTGLGSSAIYTWCWYNVPENISRTTVSKCSFVSGNIADPSPGSDLVHLMGETVIDSCEFIQNTITESSPNSLLNTDGNATITRCLFTTNTIAHTPLISITDGTTSLTECTITQTFPPDSASLIGVESSALTLNKCTIASNGISRTAGCNIRADNSSSVTIVNSIIRDFTTNLIVTHPDSISITYSNINGGWPGVGNIYSDPTFRLLSKNYLALMWGSPCIDAGTGLDPDGTPADMGAIYFHHGVGVETAPKPVATTLGTAFPNPFNPVVSIPYSTKDAGDVSLTIHNALGQRVATLVRGTLPAGHHAAVWTGRDHAGRPVASGVYLVRMVTGERTFVSKVTLVR